MKKIYLKYFTILVLVCLFLSAFTNIVVSIHKENKIDFSYNQNKKKFLENSDVNKFLSLNPEDVGSNYLSFSEMEQFLFNLSESYPDVTKLFSLGRSYEGRDVWCLEISDNPGVDEDEPGVFYMGLHHGREWPSLSICLYLSSKIVEGYDVNDTITELVDNRRVWVVPCVNPDGYHYDYDEHNGAQWWRKNRHYFDEFESYGVDLNRNYPGACNGDIFGSWGNVIDDKMATHNPKSELYCGPTSFSEYEIQFVKEMIIENDICSLISWHTYSEMVLWPWGYSTEEKTHDNNYLSKVGENISSRILTQKGDTTYEPKQASKLYPVSGDLCDWAYGYSHYVLGRPLFPYTIEACENFQPPESELLQVCKQNYKGAMYLLNESLNISKTVTPRVITSNLDMSNSDFDGDYTVSWSVKNKDSYPERFCLQELTNYSLNVEDAEDESDLWVFENFEKTSIRSHSGKQSYRSHREHKNCSAMTSKYPVFVEQGMKLSFWCNFNIQKNKDKAFVEVSRDGRNYDVLDSFDGFSKGWTHKEYTLRDYVDDSIFIRFRYVTNPCIVENQDNLDGNGGKSLLPQLYRGFFVDDIFPVSDFDNSVILSDNITDYSFNISNRSHGEYYYRVKGYNQEHGWCDYSALRKIKVGENSEPVLNKFDIFRKFFVIDGLPIFLFKEYTFVVNSTDADDDKVSYYIDWGDGSNTEWSDFVESDKTIEFKHRWFKHNEFVVRVKVKDEDGLVSPWFKLDLRTWIRWDLPFSFSFLN